MNISDHGRFFEIQSNVITVPSSDVLMMGDDAVTSDTRFCDVAST